MKTHAIRPFCRDHQSGSVALEYILVSAFAAILSIAALTFVNKIVKTKAEKIEEKLGITFDGLDEGLF